MDTSDDVSKASLDVVTDEEDTLFVPAVVHPSSTRRHKSGSIGATNA